MHVIIMMMIIDSKLACNIDIYNISFTHFRVLVSEHEPIRVRLIYIVTAGTGVHEKKLLSRVGSVTLIR